MVMEVLYVNAFIWFFTFLLYVYKRGIFTLGFFILLLYTSISFVSIHLYNSPYSLGYFSSNISLISCLYLYFIILLMSLPILRINENNIVCLKLPNIRYVNPICVVIIASSLLSYVSLIPDLKNGVSLILSDSSYAADIYAETTSFNLDNKSLTGSVDIIGVISTISKSISPLFFFIYLSIPNRNKLIMIGLFLSLFIDPLSGISKASRVLIVLPLLLLAFLFVFYNRFIQFNIRKKIYKIFILIFSLILFFFFVISQSRSDGDKELQYFQYERYFAESFLVFNNYCMDAGGTREGQRTFPLICKILGRDIYSPMELRLKYAHMKIDSSRFSTFVGDFVLDFGPELAFLIFLLMFATVYPLLKIGRCICFHQLILIFILIRILIGFFQYTYSGVGGNLVLLVQIVLYCYFRYISLYDKNPIVIYVNKNSINE